MSLALVDNKLLLFLALADSVRRVLRGIDLI